MHRGRPRCEGCGRRAVASTARRCAESVASASASVPGAEQPGTRPARARHRDPRRPRSVGRRANQADRGDAVRRPGRPPRPPAGQPDRPVAVAADQRAERGGEVERAVELRGRAWRRDGARRPSLSRIRHGREPSRERPGSPARRYGRSRRATPQSRRGHGAHRHVRRGRRPRTGGFHQRTADRNLLRRPVRCGEDGVRPWADDDDIHPRSGCPVRRHRRSGARYCSNRTPRTRRRRHDPGRPSPPLAPTVVRRPTWRLDDDVSWYGPGFYDKRTACGMAMTRSLVGVAHRSLPCGTRITFRDPVSGRTVTAPVVDRGPYVPGRTWDLTRGLCIAPRSLPYRRAVLAAGRRLSACQSLHSREPGLMAGLDGSRWMRPGAAVA